MKRLFFSLLTILYCVNVAQAQDLDTLSTGVGKDSRDQSYDEYSLKLILFERGGPYVAYVDVIIYDQQGNVLVETHSEGPWLLVDLPPGDYSVRGVRTRTGAEESAQFEIYGGEQAQVALMFPER